jgi:transcriptional regulator with XRE-family HTH domain
MSFSLKTLPELQSILGQRLRAQRLAQGIPQQELAQMAGLSPGALRKLEGSGQCSLETLLRVVQALGLVEELESLFVLRRQSIAQMEQAESVRQRQRAPRRKRP